MQRAFNRLHLRKQSPGTRHSELSKLFHKFFFQKRMMLQCQVGRAGSHINSQIEDRVSLVNGQFLTPFLQMQGRPAPSLKLCKS